MWSPAEGLWSIRMLACHIVAARAWWFHGYGWAKATMTSAA